MADSPPKDMEWTSEEEMDAFLIEVNRRKMLGESFDDMDIPIVISDADD
jgi:hypothetical protein